MSYNYYHTRTKREIIHTSISPFRMPVRGIELTEEQMDTFLELSLSEYEQ